MKKIELDNKFMTCPHCKGDGRVLNGKRNLLEDHKYMTIMLRAEGFSIREIAKKLGYKSHYVIQKFLEDKKSFKPRGIWLDQLNSDFKLLS